VLFLALGLFAQLRAPRRSAAKRETASARFFGAPVLRRSCSGTGAGSRWLAVIPYLLWWPLQPVLRDIPHAGGASTEASYYSPLARGARPALETHPPPFRIEIPPTRNHWEAVLRRRAHRASLAAGSASLDQKYNGLFYGTVLTQRNYRHWLLHNAVSYVALPDAPSDFAGQSEADFVRAGVPYLHEIWRSPHWRLYSVERARQPLLSGPRSPRAHDAPTFFHGRGPAPAGQLPHAAPLHAVLEARGGLRLRGGRAGTTGRRRDAEARQGSRASASASLRAA